MKVVCRIIFIVFLFGFFHSPVLAQGCDKKTLGEEVDHGIRAFGEDVKLDSLDFLESQYPADSWVSMPGARWQSFYYVDKEEDYSIWLKVCGNDFLVKVTYFFPQKGYEITNHILYLDGEFQSSNWDYEQRCFYQRPSYTFCQLREKVLQTLEMGEVKDFLPAGFSLNDPPLWTTKIPRERK